MKKSTRRRRLLENRPSGVYESTLQRGVYIISLANKGYTLDKIGEAMGIKKQRVSQIVKQAHMEELMKKIFRRRVARNRMKQVLNKFRTCSTCGKQYLRNKVIKYRVSCSEKCHLKRRRKWHREYKKNLYHQNKEFKIKQMAINYLRNEKRKLDRSI